MQHAVPDPGKRYEGGACFFVLLHLLVLLLNKYTLLTPPWGTGRE